MKSLSGAFVTILLLSSGVLSQSAASGVQRSATGSQSGAGPLTPQQVTELAEATRLSVDVVKLYNQQEYDAALPLAKRALEIRERILGADGPLVAAALVNLAEVYHGKRKHSESLTL